MGNQLHKLYSSLINNGECKIKDTHRLRDIFEFFDKTGNGFLSPTLDAAKAKFAEKINPLTDFIHKYFDKWPYNHAASNFNIQLKPEYLRDTDHRKMQDDDRRKWEVLFTQLKKLLDELYRAYNNFRKAVKQELHM